MRRFISITILAVLALGFMPYSYAQSSKSTGTKKTIVRPNTTKRHETGAGQSKPTPEKKNSGQTPAQAPASSKPAPAKPAPAKTNASGADTYLTVDGREAGFKAKGGTRTYTVSTDSKTWDVTGLPDFITVTGRTANTFTITCAENLSGQRSGEITVSSPKNSAVITVKQASGIGGKVNNVDVQIDTELQGHRGMTIVVDVELKGVQGHDIRGNAYFEHSDGTKLRDTNHNFGTSDGQVSTGNTLTADNMLTHWQAFEMFIPYEELHVGSGTHDLVFHVQFFDETTGRLITGSRKQSLTVSRQ